MTQSIKLAIKKLYCDDETDVSVARNALAWFTFFCRCVFAGEFYNAYMCHLASNNLGMWCVDIEAIQSDV